MRNGEKRSVLVWSGQNMIYEQSMLKICIYTGINADVSLDEFAMTNMRFIANMSKYEQI